MQIGRPDEDNTIDVPLSQDQMDQLSEWIKLQNMSENFVNFQGNVSKEKELGELDPRVRVKIDMQNIGFTVSEVSYNKNDGYVVKIPKDEVQRLNKILKDKIDREMLELAAQAKKKLEDELEKVKFKIIREEGEIKLETSDKLPKIKKDVLSKLGAKTWKAGKLTMVTIPAEAIREITDPNFSFSQKEAELKEAELKEAELKKTIPETQKTEQMMLLENERNAQIAQNNLKIITGEIWWDLSWKDTGYVLSLRNAEKMASIKPFLDELFPPKIEIIEELGQTLWVISKQEEINKIAKLTQSEINSKNAAFTAATQEIQLLTEGFKFQNESGLYDPKVDIEIETKARAIIKALKNNQDEKDEVEVYFMLYTSEDEANAIREAYRQGKRITHAIKSSTPQAQLLAKVEELLEKENPDISSFFIAPIGVYKNKHPTSEANIKYQLEALELKIKQGQAAVIGENFSQDHPYASAVSAPVINSTIKGFKNYKIEKIKANTSLLTEDKEILKNKYLLKLKNYMPKGKSYADWGRVYSPTELANKQNRNLLAYTLIKELNRANSNKKFNDVVNNFARCARNLRGTGSELYFILKDMVWEASFLENDANISKVEVNPAGIVFQGEVTKDEVFQGEVTKDDIQKYLSGDAPEVEKVEALKQFLKDKNTGDAPEVEKVEALKQFLINKIKNYPTEFTSKQYKFLTANRLRNIQANNLSEFIRIISAELDGQTLSRKNVSSSLIYNALKDTYDIIQTLPPPASSPTFHFASKSAAKLLDYVFQRETSLTYQLSSEDSYARDKTTKHIDAAGQLAHAFLKAKTQEDLYRLLLHAYRYKMTLMTSEDNKEKKSNLIKVIDDIEKEFMKVFRYRIIPERQTIDEVWEKEFGYFQNEDQKVSINNFSINNTNKAKPKPEQIFHVRALDLLSEPNEKIRHTCMCALTEAMMTSKVKANQELGYRLRARIDPDERDKVRHENPAVYLAQLCLAKMDELDPQPPERQFNSTPLKSSLQKFINSDQKFDTKEDGIIALHEIIKDSYEIKDNLKSSSPKIFSENSNNLRTFLKNFNHQLEKQYNIQKLSSLENLKS